MTATLS